jgi:hypothetical protein
VTCLWTRAVEETEESGKELVIANAPTFYERGKQAAAYSKRLLRHSVQPLYRRGWFQVSMRGNFLGRLTIILAQFRPAQIRIILCGPLYGVTQGTRTKSPVSGSISGLKGLSGYSGRGMECSTVM